MNWLQNILNWLQNRALKLPAKDDTAIAKATGTTPDTVAAVNDAASAAVTGEAAQVVEGAIASK